MPKTKFRLEYYNKGADFWWVLYATYGESLLKQELGRGIVADYMWDEFSSLFFRDGISIIEYVEVH